MEMKDNYEVSYEDLRKENEYLREQLTYLNNKQKGKIYTFYKDGTTTNFWEQYLWCERPDSSNMSLRKFTENGEVCGFMSESLAGINGDEKQWISLNEFMHNFVKVIVKENIRLKKSMKNMLNSLEKENNNEKE